MQSGRFGRAEITSANRLHGGRNAASMGSVGGDEITREIMDLSAGAAGYLPNRQAKGL
ncbi:MAG: hypothetical protein ACO1OG_02660 [Devosia sp.]